jgi:hypothetical protein
MFVGVFSMYIEALRWADTPAKDSYQMSNKFYFQKLILNWNRMEGLICKAEAEEA